MFKPNPFLKESVENKDVSMVRGALVGILQADPVTATSELENSIRYAEENGIDVFAQESDPSLSVNMNKEDWNDRYFARTLTYLRHNFTKERLLHAIEVGRATQCVQPQASVPASTQKKQTGSAQRQAPSGKTTTGKTTKRTTQKPEDTELNWVPAALVAGGAIAALVLYLLFKK